MRIKDAIYDFLLKRGTEGATDEQIQNLLKIAPDSERPARIQLIKDGWVVDSGLKRSVPNSNRKARIWVAIRGRGVSNFDIPVCSLCGGKEYVFVETDCVPCFSCQPEQYLAFLGIDTD